MSFLHEVVAHFSFDPPPSTQAVSLSTGSMSRIDMSVVDGGLLRSDLIDPTISLHHGRIVNRTGDGVLIEFGSVVDAVR